MISEIKNIVLGTKQQQKMQLTRIVKILGLTVRDTSPGKNSKEGSEKICNSSRLVLCVSIHLDAVLNWKVAKLLLIKSQRE